LLAEQKARMPITIPRVLVTPTVLRNQSGPYRDILERAGCEVIFPPAEADTFQKDQLLAQLAGVDAVVASTESFSRDVLAASRLKCVARVGVGYDAVDVPAATDLGIVVTTTPGTLEESVAELTIALILAVSRDLLRKDKEVRRGVWPRIAFPRMAGRTLGLVGMGRIGKAVVTRAQGIGMKTIAYDPFPDQDFAAAHNVTLCTFDELLSAADIVSLHLPSTTETVDLMNATAFAKMKPGSIFVNTSRGGMVDEDALCDALKSGLLLGAALDVFKLEPLPLASPLLSLDNVLLCTHMGGLDREAQIAASSLAAQCIADLAQGRWPEGCVINKQLGPDWKWETARTIA
jgi:D-3-phosphoglycerate dehydrogenase